MGWLTYTHASAHTSTYVYHTGFDPTLPSIWLVEGLLPYLPEEEVTRLLKRMRALAPPGSYMGADHPGTRLKDSAASAAIRKRLDEMKVPLVRTAIDG